MTIIFSIGIFKAAQTQTSKKIAQQSIRLKIDSDLLTWLQSQETPYQTQINQVLRAYIATQQFDPQGN